MSWRGEQKGIGEVLDPDQVIGDEVCDATTRQYATVVKHSTTVVLPTTAGIGF